MSSLGRPVLVLNKVWMAIRIITVKRALKLVFADRASIVLPSDYSVYNWDKWVELDVLENEGGISTTRGDVKIPEVLVLSNYDKVYRKNVRLTKRNIYIRDKYKCQYSGKKISYKDADIDHVIPRSKGGKNTWDNMVVCSKEINRQKRDRTPEEAGLKLIRHPTKPPSGELLIDPKLKMPSSWDKFMKGNG